MRKHYIILVIILAVLFLLLTSGCKQKQEEFQMEFIEQLKKLNVYIYPDGKYSGSVRKIRLDEGVEIMERALEVHLRVYVLYTGTENAPTTEEVSSLYHKYQEDIFKRFDQFYQWYRAVGSRSVGKYKDALIKANLSAYADKKGIDQFTNEEIDNILDEVDYLSLEELIELEKYFPDDWKR